jgi:hypothetical protein
VTKDPLIARPTNQRELFQQFAKTAHGFSAEDVLAASLNMIANAIRQTHAKRDVAMARLDQLMGEARRILADNYTPTGKRLNGSYPFDQNIEVPLIKMPVKW